MARWKRTMCVALCLCALCALLPSRAAAAPAGVYPSVVIDGSKVHKEVLKKKDIAGTTYAPGKQDSDSTAKSTITECTSGQCLRFETALNRLSELYFVPFTTSLKVPAHTTCTVKQTFHINGAKQIATKDRATSAASFQLLYFGEEAPFGTAITPRTEANKNYGASNGSMLFQGSRQGRSNKDNGDYNTDRKINLEGCGNTNTLTLVYKNTTGKEKTISYHFAFWGCTQYGSKYDNRFLVEFTTSYEVTSTEQVILAPTGGTVGLTEKTVTYGDSYGSLPIPTRPGYTFDGWFTAKTGGEKITSASKVTTFGVHTLYARWAGRQYTVTLEANGGAVDPKTMTVTYGDPYGTLAPPPPTRPGYTFSGWYTEASGGSQITAKSTVRTNAAHTLYARWRPIAATKPSNVSVVTSQTIVYGKDPAFNLRYNSAAAHTYTVKWYECDKSGNGGKLVTNGSGAAASPKMPAAGVHYYYAEVTAKRGDNGQTASAKSPVAKVTVNKATPMISTKPTASTLDLAKNTALRGSTLSGGKAQNKNVSPYIDVPGSFQWQNGSTTITKTGEQSFPVVFTPDDTDNYTTATVMVPVGVVRTNTVTITWGALAYTYTDGPWDPKTHAYTAGSWKADSTGGDTITVKNEGTNAVNVTFRYAATNDAISGSFSSAKASLSAGRTQTVTLSLTGKPTQSLANAKIGTVTVTLGGGT